MPPPPVYPIDHDAIRIALVAMVGWVTGLDSQHVVMAEPEVSGAPRPCKPYVSLKCTDPSIKYGRDSVMLPGEGETLTTYGGQRGVSFSFNFYGRSHEEANSLAGLLQAALGTAPVYELLRSKGIGVLDPGPVRDLSEMMNTGWEGRSQMDCLFGVASNLRVDLGHIEQAPFAGTIG